MCSRGTRSDLVLDVACLLNHDFGETRQSWGARDAILYALGVGLGRDPLNRAELRFLDERSLSVLPTFAVTLASPGMWIRDPKFGVDFGKLVHFAQSAEFPTPLLPEGEIVGAARVLSISDRGVGKGSFLVLERRISDAASGALYCRLEQTLLLRGDGGFGGPQAVRGQGYAFERTPDASTSFETSPRAALIYRLSGDWNPLHLDPDFAAKAGFERPVLHGLASYAISGVAVSRAAERDPADIAQLSCRFSGVVIPGDEIRLDLWHEEEATHFRGFVGERKVLDDGLIRWKNI